MSSTVPIIYHGRTAGHESPTAIALTNDNDGDGAGSWRAKAKEVDLEALNDMDASDKMLNVAFVVSNFHYYYLQSVTAVNHEIIDMPHKSPSTIYLIRLEMQ